MGESTITTGFLVLTVSCAILTQEMIGQDDSSWFDQHNDVYAEHSVQNRTVDIRSDVIRIYLFYTDFHFLSQETEWKPKNVRICHSNFSRSSINIHLPKADNSLFEIQLNCGEASNVTVMLKDRAGNDPSRSLLFHNHREGLCFHIKDTFKTLT